MTTNVQAPSRRIGYPVRRPFFPTNPQIFPILYEILLTCYGNGRML